MHCAFNHLSCFHCCFVIPVDRSSSFSYAFQVIEAVMNMYQHFKAVDPVVEKQKEDGGDRHTHIQSNSFLNVCNSSKSIINNYWRKAVTSHHKKSVLCQKAGSRPCRYLAHAKPFLSMLISWGVGGRRPCCLFAALVASTGNPAVLSALCLRQPPCSLLQTNQVGRQEVWVFRDLWELDALFS